MAEMKRLSRGIPDIVRHRATEGKTVHAGSAIAKMRMRRHKMGPLKRLTFVEDPLEGAEIGGDEIDSLNGAINAIGKTVNAERARIAQEERGGSRERQDRHQ